MVIWNKIYAKNQFQKIKIVIYKKGKGVIAEVGETFENLVSEAKAELSEVAIPEAH
jgi:Protein of unknown function (DUF5132)